MARAVWRMAGRVVARREPRAVSGMPSSLDGRARLVEDRRLAYALLLSLTFHALLLSLNFRGQGLGLPGFGFPWQERRVQAPDLVVRLVPPLPPTPPAQAAIPPVAQPLHQPLVAPTPAPRPRPARSAPSAWPVPSSAT